MIKNSSFAQLTQWHTVHANGNGKMESAFGFKFIGPKDQSFLMRQSLFDLPATTTEGLTVLEKKEGSTVLETKEGSTVLETK